MKKLSLSLEFAPELVPELAAELSPELAAELSPELAGEIKVVRHLRLTPPEVPLMPVVGLTRTLAVVTNWSLFVFSVLVTEALRLSLVKICLGCTRCA